MKLTNNKAYQCKHTVFFKKVLSDQTTQACQARWLSTSYDVNWKEDSKYAGVQCNGDTIAVLASSWVRSVMLELDLNNNIDNDELS